MMTTLSPTWQTLVANWDIHRRARHHGYADALMTDVGYSEATAGLMAGDRLAGEDQSITPVTPDRLGPAVPGAGRGTFPSALASRPGPAGFTARGKGHPG